MTFIIALFIYTPSSFDYSAVLMGLWKQWVCITQVIICHFIITFCSLRSFYANTSNAVYCIVVKYSHSFTVINTCFYSTVRHCYLHAALTALL